MATAGLEPYGSVGLLRSLAVADSQRGLGLGQQLVVDRLRAARRHGLRAVYLLTTTAEHYFCCLGFRDATRQGVPAPLPLVDSVPADHPKVVELRGLSEWSEGQVWSSPERHGAVTGVMKNQIDWIPLSIGAVRPTQGRTLAVMQVSGGSQSFNAVNTLRLLGRWMRMFTIPKQSSVAKAYEQFEEDGTMKDSSYRDRVVDVMEELYKMTLLLRDHVDYLSDRHSERREAAAKLVAEVAAKGVA